jgi:DNA-binding transcriptional regulator YiaG
MSPEEFKSARLALGMSQNDIAEFLGVASDRTVRRWEEGEKDIPGPVLLVMELIFNVPEAAEYLDLDLPDTIMHKTWFR